MKGFASVLQDKLSKVSEAFGRNIVLNIISSSFMMIMSITIVGSFAALFKGLDIGGYQAFLQSSGLYGLLDTIYTFTVGSLSLFVVFCVGYQYATKKGMKKDAITIGLTSLVGFLAVTPYTPGESAYAPAILTTSWLGASGMFCAILIAFLTGTIYHVCKKYHLEIKLPEQVPPMVARQFSAMIPGFLCAICYMLIVKIFALTPIGNVQDAVYALVKIPLTLAGSNIFGLWLLQVFCYLMWFFGIHGGMVVMPIQMVLFMQAQYENLAAYQAGMALPNWITGTILSIGNGSLPLLVALLLFAKSKQNRAIMKMAIIPACFGIDEPSYFGIPMIMNPIFFIPWVILVPSLTVFGTYILQAIGVLGYATGASTGGFVPFFVTNMVSYGVSGVIFGCIIFVLAVLIYYPFMKAYDKQCLEKENAAGGSEEEA